jgi:PAS domain S-box-containing protein
MIELDLRTVFFNFLLTALVCLTVMFFLWYQARDRFKGIEYLVLDMLFQVLCIGLIFLRGYISKFISIDVSNTLGVTGALLGFIGLEYFADKKSNQLHNIILIVAFFVVHTYFTYVNSNLAIRNLNSAIVYLIICSQCAWLLLRRLTKIFSRIYFHVGIVFVLFSVVNLSRILYFFFSKHLSLDYYHGRGFDMFVVISYQTLFLLLVFFLTLMVNKRLLSDISTQEEKFSKAFHSAPYAIMLARLSDGKIVEVNDGFKRILGYNATEATGKTTEGLHIWSNIADRGHFIELLNETGAASNVEFPFQKKSGERIMGEISGEIININNEKCTLTVIHDITDKKLAEKKLVESQGLLRRFASHLQNVGEEEKVLLADRIDNELNQTLAALKMDIGLLKKKVVDKDFQLISDDLFEKLDRAYDIAGESLANSVKLMSGLRHEVLHLMGFTEAIKLYISEFELSNQIQCEFNSPEPDVQLHQNESTVLFKVFQSAMANIAQHSKATEVNLSLQVIENNLIFEIADDGAGFKFDDTLAITSNGLMLMRESVLLLEGQFELKTAPGLGTIIRVSMPYIGSNMQGDSRQLLSFDSTNLN